MTSDWRNAKEVFKSSYDSIKDRTQFPNQRVEWSEDQTVVAAEYALAGNGCPNCAKADYCPIKSGTCYEWKGFLWGDEQEELEKQEMHKQMYAKMQYKIDLMKEDYAKRINEAMAVPDFKSNIWGDWK